MKTLLQLIIPAGGTTQPVDLQQIGDDTGQIFFAVTGDGNIHIEFLPSYTEDNTNSFHLENGFIYTMNPSQLSQSSQVQWRKTGGGSTNGLVTVYESCECSHCKQKGYK